MSSEPKPDRWSARSPVALGMLSLAALLGGFGYWSAVTEISGAIIAGGQIEVEQNRQIVQHPDGGVVAEILVSEGDTVGADQLLIRLDPTLLEAELAVVEGQLYEAVALRARLEAERDEQAEINFDPELLEAQESNPRVKLLVEGQTRLFETRRVAQRRELDQLSRQREQIVNQVTGIDAQIKSIDSQLALIAEELSSQESLLERGLAQVSRVLALKRETASLEGRRGELVASRAVAGERITENEIIGERLLQRRREEALTGIRDLSARELELRERRGSLRERVGRLEIRAPVGGVVYDMQVFAPRQVIRPAEAVLYIVPQDRPLVIAAKVSPIHVDQVHAGQDVILRFSTFDSRTTPELAGTVTQVSADAFTDDRIGTYYRALVRVNEGELEKLPRDKVLVPGMPVEAFIKTGDRTPMEYLVKPMSDYLNRAFRES